MAISIPFEYRIIAECKGEKDGDEILFAVEETFTNEISSLHFDVGSAAQVSPAGVGYMIGNRIATYATNYGIDLTSISVERYKAESNNPEIWLFLDINNPSTETSDKEAGVYAYYPYAITEPNPPSDVLTEATIDSISLSWKDNSSGEDGFRIYNRFGSLLAQVQANTLAWRDTNLNPGQEYEYQICSYNSVGESERVVVRVKTLVPEWDPELVEETKVDREEDGYLLAFQSGVGDNLDLKVRAGRDSSSYETFAYTLQTRAIIQKTLNVYPKRYFRYRFIAYGGDLTEEVQSMWYEGEIDGEAPLYEEKSGKKDFIIPLDLYVDSTSDDEIHYRVEIDEMDGENKRIKYRFESNGGETTTSTGDSVIFTTVEDATEEIVAKIPWYGPKQSVKANYLVRQGEIITISDRIYAPVHDPRYLTELAYQDIIEWSTVATSDNYNVRIWTSQNPISYLPGDNLSGMPHGDWVSQFDRHLPIELQASVINTTQVPWSPKIHNGYYYLNQAEYYLHSESKVQGYYKGSREFVPFEFVYAIEMLAEDIRTGEVVRFSASSVGEILADNLEHRVSSKTVYQTMEEALIARGINRSDLNWDEAVFEAVISPSEEEWIAELRIREDGHVYGRTTTLAEETVFDQVVIRIDDEREALVGPIPQQGSPVIITGENKEGEEVHFRQVSFYTEDGQLTLENTEIFEIDGNQDLYLEHINIDPETLFVEREVLNEQNFYEYMPIEGWIRYENHIVLPQVLPRKTKVRVRYKLKDSFYIHHNFNVEQDYAKVEVHSKYIDQIIELRQQLVEAKRQELNPDPEAPQKEVPTEEIDRIYNENPIEIKVIYETNRESAYYLTDEIDLNPMKTKQSSGFLYIAKEEEEPTRVEINVNPRQILTKEEIYIRCFVLDRHGNPVPGEEVLWESNGDGPLDKLQPVTDMNGLSVVKYTATDDNETVTFKATCGQATSQESIEVKQASITKRIALIADQNVLEGDQLQLEVYLFDENEEPSYNSTIELTATGGAFFSKEGDPFYTGETDPHGRISVPFFKKEDDPRCVQITASYGRDNIQEQINIRIK